MSSSDITVGALAAISDVAGNKLSWTYSDPRSNALPNIGLDMVEVHASATNDRTAATKVGEGITDFLHAGLSRGAVRYYWIKARDYLGGYGDWYPSSPTGGVQGTEASGDVLIAANGYWKHPSGLIFQWGSSNTPSDPTTVTFPLAFPNAALMIVLGTAAAPSSVQAFVASWADLTTTGVNLRARAIIDSGAGTTDIQSTNTAVGWLAVGY